MPAHRTISELHLAAAVVVQPHALGDREREIDDVARVCLPV